MEATMQVEEDKDDKLTDIFENFTKTVQKLQEDSKQFQDMLVEQEDEEEEEVDEYDREMKEKLEKICRELDEAEHPTSHTKESEGGSQADILLPVEANEYNEEHNDQKFIEELDNINKTLEKVLEEARELEEKSYTLEIELATMFNPEFLEEQLEANEMCESCERAIEKVKAKWEELLKQDSEKVNDNDTVKGKVASTTDIEKDQTSEAREENMEGRSDSHAEDDQQVDQHDQQPSPIKTDGQENTKDEESASNVE